MIEFRVTFGQQYHHMPHPTLPEANPDGWLAVMADDETLARVAVFDRIGSAWSSIYGPDDDHYPTADGYYPRGELARIAPPRVYTGATLLETAKVYEDYVKALCADDGPIPAGWRKEVAGALGALIDALHNQITDPEPADSRDACTAEEIAKELGLCPDSGDHLYGAACASYECPTWREAEYEGYVADTGWLR
jgi:hypothetical protein